VRVEVRLFAYLRKLFPGGFHDIELAEESTLEDIINVLELTEEKSLIIMVNGRREEITKTLRDGDRIGIFPPVGGG